jgi:Lipase (class 3)
MAAPVVAATSAIAGTIILLALGLAEESGSTGTRHSPRETGASDGKGRIRMSRQHGDSVGVNRIQAQDLPHRQKAPVDKDASASYDPLVPAKIPVADTAQATDPTCPSVISYREADVILGLVEGRLKTDDMLVVTAIAKASYFPNNVVAGRTGTDIWILHRSSLDGSANAFRIDESSPKFSRGSWIHGIPRILHFSFRDPGGKLVYVYSICGSDLVGDFVADGAFIAALRLMFRKQKPGLTIRSVMPNVEHHAGIVSYAGNAYDLIGHHLRSSTEKPQRVCLYGHSLGGSSCMVVAHKLHFMREGANGNDIGASTTVQCATLSSPNYIRGVTEISMEKATMGDKLNIRNYANAGDATIFNPMFRSFSYPVNFDEGVGSTSPSSTFGITTWGDLDPENILNIGVKPTGFLVPLLATLAFGLEQSAITFNHTNVSVDGKIFVPESMLESTTSTMKRMCSEIRRRVIKRQSRSHGG